MASFKKFFERRRNPWKGIGYDAYKAFRKDGIRVRLERYDSLPEAPKVLDFGGYIGEWSDRVLAQYPKATIHMFEPHPKFAAQLLEKYADNQRLHVHDFALGADNRTLQLSDAADGSSSVAAHTRKFEARVVAVDSFIGQWDLSNVDLAKINIEGGEYDLLPALVDAGVIAQIEQLQVQFHLFEEWMLDARDSIRTQLSVTHVCTWSYPFVWEEWRRKPRDGQETV